MVPLSPEIKYMFEHFQIPEKQLQHLFLNNLERHNIGMYMFQLMFLRMLTQQ